MEGIDTRIGLYITIFLLVYVKTKIKSVLNSILIVNAINYTVKKFE